MARRPTTAMCCGRVPLRSGLLAWAYIKLIIALTSIGVYLSRYEMRNFVDHINDTLTNKYAYHTPADYALQQLGPLGVCLLYLVFSIIFVIGVRGEKIKLLQAFQVYSIFEVMSGAVLVGMQLYYVQAAYAKHGFYYMYNHFYGNYEEFQRSPYDIVFYLGLILPVVINILLPIYFSVLIQSEVHRLKRARGETSVVFSLPVTKEQDKAYYFA